MKNTSPFSLKKVVIAGLALAGVIYAGYATVEKITRPPSYSALLSIPKQLEPILSPVVSTNPSTKRGLAFLEMPVYPEDINDPSPIQKEKHLNYIDYKEKSNKEVVDVFTVLREAGNGCFNQWPIGEIKNSQVEIQVRSYLSGCTREQILKMAATVKMVFNKAETVSSFEPYRLLEAALEFMPGITDDEKGESFRYLDSIIVARNSAMSVEYFELDNMYSSQCKNDLQSIICEELKNRIEYYFVPPDES